PIIINVAMYAVVRMKITQTIRRRSHYIPSLSKIPPDGLSRAVISTPTCKSTPMNKNQKWSSARRRSITDGYGHVNSQGSQIASKIIGVAVSAVHISGGLIECIHPFLGMANGGQQTETYEVKY